jgi:hypothetical protein
MQVRAIGKHCDIVQEHVEFGCQGGAPSYGWSSEGS